MAKGKFSKIVSLLIPIGAGVAAAYWTPLSFWFDMKEGLIAFFGFLAASLVQLMPITANFIQSDKLNPSEAEKLTRSLTKQQHYWIGLLSLTIVALVSVIVGSALKAPLAKYDDQVWYGLTYSSSISFAIAFFTFAVLVKILDLFEGILSLHKLRGELVILAARRSAQEKADILNASAADIKISVPKDYGKIIS